MTLTTKAVLAAILLAGSGSGAAQAQTVLRYVPQSDVSIMDPVANTAGVTLQHAYMVYDQLFAADERYVAQPQMVGSHEVSADGLTHTFRLRPGLRFHDGTPVRAADAVQSITRWSKKDSNGQKLTEFGMALSVVDDSTFRMTLREAFGPVASSFAKIAASGLVVMREADAKTDPNTPVTATVGSGPFRFNREMWSPGNRRVYDRNPDYVPRSEPASMFAGGRVVKVDRVEWQIIADANTAVAALAAGEVDIYETPPNDLVPVLKRNPNITVKVHNKAGNMAYLRPNQLFPPFNDVRARMALMHMMQQEDYLRSAFGSDEANWKTCWAVMVCGSAMGSEAGAERFGKPDVAKARQLLKESGYNGEPVLVLQPTDQQVLRDLTEVAIAQMKAIGINVDVQAGDWAQISQRRARKDEPSKGGWQLFATTTLSVLMFDGVSNFPIVSTCDKAWFGWPCDKDLETLRDQWIREPDDAKRKAIAVKLQERAMVSVPLIMIGQAFSPVAYRNSVTGFLEGPVPVFWNVEKRS